MARCARSCARYGAPLCVAAISACAPVHAGQTWEPNNTIDEQSQDEEREANRAALAQLMQAARETAAERSDDGPPRDLAVVVVAPEPQGVNADGSLQREAVAAFVADSPHQILGAITFEPVHVDGEAYGYRILSFREHGAWLERAGLRVGDAVHTVNGRTLLQPDSVMQLWETLPDQDELRVVLLRQGREHTLLWAIREADGT